MDDPSTCDDGTTCSYFNSNPNGGAISYDSVATTSISILQV